MQYPTLSIEPLSHIQTYQLENKDNFEQLLKKNSYNAVFKDRFAGDWGHTTELGHQAIADNVFNFLFDKKLIPLIP